MGWRLATPYDYGDPDAEVRAVQEAAGLIDDLDAGKLIVSGPRRRRFLDRLYPNRHGDLKPGPDPLRGAGLRRGADHRRRHDLRLDDDSFYVTTTSTGAEAIEAWFAWWLADWSDLRVTLTDVTQALCAVNLAGPRARRSWGALRPSTARTRSSAISMGSGRARRRRALLLLRIGFFGELGYKIPTRSPGRHVWDTIMEAGREHGISAFGLEPQRVLRLHKMHILVGQDTDSESDPVASAMPWIIKLDKEQDFIGRWALEEFAEHDPALRWSDSSSGTRCRTRGRPCWRAATARWGA